MKVIHSTAELTALINDIKKEGKTIGFTPTMGALHEGHFSLIQRSVAANDVSMCSIFVNPTQFNNAEDLNKYPRTLEDDCRGLEDHGCDIVFAPTIGDIYPGGEEKWEVEIDLQGLDKRMEGEHRPGHFAGVVQVVKRLLEIAQCDRLYMGQKDFQQFTIIRYMIDYFDIPVELVVCPIKREEDGLAMSSRNRRLTVYHRSEAPILHKVLTKAKNWIEVKSVDEIEMIAMQLLDFPGFRPEYFTIIDGHTLEPIDSIAGVSEVVACTAVWAGDIRLIDNMILKSIDE